MNAKYSYRLSSAESRDVPVVESMPAFPICGEPGTNEARPVNYFTEAAAPVPSTRAGFLSLPTIFVEC